MISINNLGLAGLKTILNIQSSTTSQPTDSPKVQDILQSQSDSLLVSAAAKSIGTTYQRLKATGNEAAVSGFSKIVQSFGSSITGSAIADIATATSNMSSEDLQDYGSLAGAVSDLGNSAVFAKFATQAATAFNADQGLGRSYLNASAAIVNAQYSGDRQQVIDQTLTNMSDFMARFGELGNPAEAGNTAVNSFTEFADSVAAMGEGTEIATAIGDYAAPTEDAPSA